MELCLATGEVVAPRWKLPEVQSSGGERGLAAIDIVPRLVDLVRSRFTSVERRPKSLEEQAFVALAAAKAWTSQVTMHLGVAARDRIFGQLNRLHDVEEWSEDQRPVALDSYKTFIRFMLIARGGSKPALGLSVYGNIFAAWQSGDDRLTVEFVNEREVGWVVSRKEAEGVERAAGNTSRDRLMNNLSPYKPEVWFILEG